MPSHDCSSNTEQVKLCGHIDSQQLQLQDLQKFYFAFSANIYGIFIISRHIFAEFILFVSRGVWRCKYDNLGSSLTLPFLLSLFQIIKGGIGVVGFMAALSPGLTPASTGSGWCVNAMRGDLVWEVRALKSNFPGFLSEPGEDSPGKKKWDQQKKWGEEGGEERGGFNQQNVAYLIGYTKKKDLY